MQNEYRIVIAVFFVLLDVRLPDNSRSYQLSEWGLPIFDDSVTRPCCMDT